MEAALISASVSVLLFIAAQWWTSASKRSDLLRTKLEDVHQRISVLEKRPILPRPTMEIRESLEGMLSLLTQFEEEYRHYRVQQIQLSALIRLYFPPATSQWKSILALAEEICNNSHSRFHGKSDFDDDKEDRRLVTRIEDLLSFLETNQDELIKSPGWVLRNLMG